MDGDRCILLLRGVRPFYSRKFDITKHKRYKELADFDKRNAFDITEYRKCRLEIGMDEEFSLFEAGAGMEDEENKE